MINLNAQTQARLRFLNRVVAKEIDLVAFAASQLFEEPFTLERANQLETDPLLALKLEAFTSRFCRLQDTLGDKLLPTILKALGEQPAPFIQNLNKAEQLGWLSSADDWMALRQLRNQMIHEYIEDVALLTDAVQMAYKHIALLNDFANKLKLAVVV